MAMPYNLTGKTVLITGATDGLGKQVAMAAAKAGATLLLHGRNKVKGSEVLKEVEAASSNEHLFYYNADFSSLQEVKELSEHVLREHQQLHVLINNAAIGGGPKGSRTREFSKDGLELRFAVNYLAHFTLTQNLLPLLIHAAPARIVNVSSIGQSPLDFADLMLQKHYDSSDAYCKSKLAQILYGMELAERLQGKGVIVNSLHPASLMNTNMVKEYYGRTLSTVEEGLEVVEHVAFSPATAHITGAYFDQLIQGTAHKQAYDEAARKRLWDASIELARNYLLPSE
jgi:NAD(P)-dependent dehydrogenase (short-subunit alcohol dehydrogenase family)